ncbi:MAG: type III-A CRISPR-associated RAMP protein Csm5 [Desulfuromonadales bacterium]|nr:MAG: type III-A CRISPR-associated RAMP protein Csm5 [Desulfuromonadales bacterium]
MIGNRFDEVSITAEVLSPVHIGDGEELDPLHYVIKDGRLHRIALEEWLSAQDEKKLAEFKRLTVGGNDGALTGLRRYLRDTIDLAAHAYWSAPVTAAVAARYEDRFDAPENRLPMRPFIRSGDRPYLPGSSIKGAIRTAYLHSLTTPLSQNDLRNLKKSRCDIVEGRLLGAIRPPKKEQFDIDKDPFRAVRVRDAFLPDDTTCFAEIINHKRIEDRIDPISVQLIHEIITPLDGLTFPLSIGVNSPLLDHPKSGIDATHRRLSVKTLLECCDTFYRQALAEEKQLFLENVKNNDELIEAYDKIAGRAQGGYLLRLGYASGVVSMTIRKELRTAKEYGTSKHLYEGRLPLGFVKLTID